MRAVPRLRSAGVAAAAVAIALLVVGCGQDTAPATAEPTDPARMEKLLNDAESAASAAETDVAADD